MRIHSKLTIATKLIVLLQSIESVAFIFHLLFLASEELASFFAESKDGNTRFIKVSISGGKLGLTNS